MHSSDPEKTYPARALKHCPYCGGQDLAFIKTNAFSCSSCGRPLYLNVAAAVAAIIERPDGAFLLARRAHEPAKGLLDLPGGFLDPLESAETALAREIKEELNLDIADLTFFGTFPNRYVYKGLTYFTCDIVFRCGAARLDQPQFSDEIADVVFARPEQVPMSEIGFESMRTILEAYRRFRVSPQSR